MKFSLNNLRQAVSRKKKMKRGGYFWRFCFSVALFAVSSSIFYVAFLFTQLPSPDKLNAKKISQSTKIFDRTGEVQLLEAYGEERRTVIPFEEIPMSVRNATLAAEDPNFYNEPAFNIKGIIRALLANLKAGRVTQGGSTVSQQLVKNVFLTPEKTLVRKIKELILAIEVETKYSKDEILGLYLNQIPYGSNAYGVEEASKTYFDKSAKGLTVAESAALASMPRAPSYYSPWGGHLNDLLQRKDYVLDRMLEFGFISSDEHKKAAAEKLVFQKKPAEVKAYHFALMVRQYLIDKYGEDTVVKGGLRVKTTLDWRLQEVAERVVKAGAERNSELYEGYNSAMVAQDPKTGQILAMVGSRDFASDPLPLGCVPGVSCKFEPDFNVAVQGLRQPGSALKPFAYLTSFEKGYTPQTLVFDVPTEFSANNPSCPALVDFSIENPECFHPRNFDDFFRGPTTFAQGLAQSINVPSVKALYLAGFDEVLKNLKKFGISTLNERGRYGLSLVLGGGEVRLVELVNAYATLAGNGEFHNQSFILEVADSNGKVLESFKDKSENVIDSEYPRLINQILSDSDLRAGLFHGSLFLTVFPGYEVALKTGTTNDYRDAWALGYTPFLTVGVWSGNNDNTPMQRKGGSILAAVPIWSDFLKEALQYFSPESFRRPDPPFISSKPMLSGNYIYNPALGGISYPQTHSILYYVKKSDPLGPMPSDPYNDPQFSNWEFSTVEWAKANVPGFAAYNKPLPAGAYENQLIPKDDINISNFSPASGSFVKSPFLTSAYISAKANVNKIEIYFNGRLVTAMQPKTPTYSLNWFVFDQLQSQNNLEVRVTDANGKETKETSIIYN